MRYNFEWDPVKAKQNRRKHRISFERAAELFLDPLAVSEIEEEHGEAEERWVTIGRDSHGKLLVVVHTFLEVAAQECKVRIISARNATKCETREHEATQLMKKEYDFPKGVRGKFYRPNAELNIPVYLDPDVAKVVRARAEKTDESFGVVVNDWLRQDIRFGGPARRLKVR